MALSLTQTQCNRTLLVHLISRFKGFHQPGEGFIFSYWKLHNFPNIFKYGTTESFLKWYLGGHVILDLLWSFFLFILALKITSSVWEASVSIKQCLLDVFQSGNPLSEDFSVCSTVTQCTACGPRKWNMSETYEQLTVIWKAIPNLKTKKGFSIHVVSSSATMN